MVEETGLPEKSLSRARFVTTCTISQKIAISILCSSSLSINILVPHVCFPISGVVSIPVKHYFKVSFSFNPLTPVSDQDRIYPYCICTISCRQVTRIKKNNHGITN